MIKPMEFKLEMPLEGVVSFSQQIERFLKLCECCRSSSGEEKLLCSFWAREALDRAYSGYLANFSLILPILNGTKPLCLDSELDPGLLKQMLNKQLESLNSESISEYLELIDQLRNRCPSRECNPELISAELAKLHKLSSDLKHRIQRLYLEDFLGFIRRNLENAIKDPEMFKSMFPLPPKPLKEEYRI